MQQAWKKKGRKIRMKTLKQGEESRGQGINGNTNIKADF
jgi:hypothetical protein